TGVQDTAHTGTDGACERSGQLSCLLPESLLRSNAKTAGTAVIFYLATDLPPTAARGVGTHNFAHACRTRHSSRAEWIAIRLTGGNVHHRCLRASGRIWVESATPN